MSRTLPFIKMQGLGNDFLVFENLEPEIATRLNDPKFIQFLADRRLGIGADQLFLVHSPKTPQTDAFVEIWNSDGSKVGMCGNGLRALARFLAQKSPNKKNFKIELESGIYEAEILSESAVEVSMGIPKFGRGFKPGLAGSTGQTIEIDGTPLKFFEVDVGNPHAIFFVSQGSDEFLDSVADEVGPVVERHPLFPKRTNVEFVFVEKPGKIIVSVWERGAGRTLACGSGASAAAAVAIALGRAKTPLEVVLPGGTLQISWNGKEKNLQVKGPVQEVFRGELKF